jgi:hypothetical protein
MPASERLSRLAPYARRLLDDDMVQNQIDRAISNLRGGTRRARGKGAKKAVSDRKTRRQFSAAAAATTQIVRALREPPPPKRHLARRVAALSLLAAGATVGYRRLSAATPASGDE